MFAVPTFPCIKNPDWYNRADEIALILEVAFTFDLGLRDFRYCIGSCIMFVGLLKILKLLHFNKDLTITK